MTKAFGAFSGVPSILQITIKKTLGKAPINWASTSEKPPQRLKTQW